MGLVVFGVEIVIELAAQCELAAERFVISAAAALDVLEAERGIADRERGELGLEEAGAGVTVSSTDEDEGRQVRADAPGELGDP